MILEPEVMDVSDLSIPRDVAIAYLAQVYNVPFFEAEFMVALERGEIDGDITKRDKDGVLRQLNGNVITTPQAKHG